MYSSERYISKKSRCFLFLKFLFSTRLPENERVIKMDSPVSSQDDRDIEVNVVSGASSPDITSSPSRNDQKSPFYDLKKDKEEKATGSAPYTSFSISSILNRAEPRRESNVLEAALAANHFGSANDAMLSR